MLSVAFNSGFMFILSHGIGIILMRRLFYTFNSLSSRILLHSFRQLGLCVLSWSPGYASFVKGGYTLVKLAHPFEALTHPYEEYHARDDGATLGSRAQCSALTGPVQPFTVPPSNLTPQCFITAPCMRRWLSSNDSAGLRLFTWINHAHPQVFNFGDIGTSYLWFGLTRQGCFYIKSHVSYLHCWHFFQLQLL